MIEEGGEVQGLGVGNLGDEEELNARRENC